MNKILYIGGFTCELKIPDHLKYHFGLVYLYKLGFNNSINNYFINSIKNTIKNNIIIIFNNCINNNI
ncbi:hypothetical protein MBBAR_5c00890 [Methanobrevibacter arboriphilus JCM 13429 = DSM 1125]|uniref:Uncharacterized protein n=1 Tax=Methanobrevibacter arboriphilus JCM 13429 = DSM 1125 TaxID=1300164 RepID=A0A1V6N439_METAZ|nr:hypothetical protein MBBAR_5c00890 [Methanobrevibacter arboriphilus JCM 13429 = DSM 1125]